MDNHDHTINEQQKRVLHALREAPQSTFTLRSRYNVMHPGARIQELRGMGYRIDAIRQTRVDDYGRKHPAVALYVLVEERKCA
jgi:hypothetical protein